LSWYYAPMDKSQKSVSPVASPPSEHQKVRFIEIDADQAGQRIDNFLVTLLKGVPKSRVYRIVRKGEVRVNKGRVKAEYKLQAGDVVRVPPIRQAQAPELAKPSQTLTGILENSIIYESKGLLIINKPSGLAVHGGSGVNLGLIEALRQIRPQDRYLELVHRLDKDTSGCIMVARKRSMLRHLQDLLRKGRKQDINKTYHALVEGQWPSKCNKVDAPLRKSESPGGGRIVRVDQSGKPSLTLFKVLKRFKDCTLIEAKPITGRTHQIRVHAQYAGCSLVGDDKYGNDDFSRRMKSKGIGRLCLHAARLEVRLPDQEQLLRVEAPLDLSLASAIERLESD
jgi:23S rRNA pseudouridine955/2504/2580 synthase